MAKTYLHQPELAVTQKFIGVFKSIAVCFYFMSSAKFLISDFYSSVSVLQLTKDIYQKWGSNSQN